MSETKSQAERLYRLLKVIQKQLSKADFELVGTYLYNENDDVRDGVRNMIDWLLYTQEITLRVCGQEMLFELEQRKRPACGPSLGGSEGDNKSTPTSIV